MDCCHRRPRRSFRYGSHATKNEPMWWWPPVEDWASETQTYVFSHGFLCTHSRFGGPRGMLVRERRHRGSAPRCTGVKARAAHPGAAPHGLYVGPALPLPAAELAPPPPSPPRPPPLAAPGSCAVCGPFCHRSGAWSGRPRPWGSSRHVAGYLPRIGASGFSPQPSGCAPAATCRPGRLPPAPAPRPPANSPAQRTHTLSRATGLSRADSVRCCEEMRRDRERTASASAAKRAAS